MAQPSPPFTTPHATFVRAIAFMTTRPHSSDLLPNARHSNPSTKGTASAERVFPAVHGPAATRIPAADTTPVRRVTAFPR